MGGMDREWAAAARLVRRTGFGATGAEVDAAVQVGPTAYVRDALTDQAAQTGGRSPSRDPGAVKTPPPTFARVERPAKSADKSAKRHYRRALHGQGAELVGWWLRRMAASDRPFTEKAAFVWHAHFATSLQKVKIAELMLRQNETQRRLATGDFGALAYAMLTDAATLRWLDGGRNTVQGPNENLSREFMEIFTLGHADGYTESDVRAGARALTGWRIDPRDGSTSVHPALHDTTSKTFLGVSGNLDAHGFCAAVLARPGCAPYVVGRLWQHFVSDTPPAQPVLDRLVAAYGSRRDLAALCTALLTDPAFAAAQGTLVIGPVEWLVGAVRALRVPFDDAAAAKAAGVLDSLGQLPFFPPSVGGWPSGRVWLSTAAADLRFRAAATLVGAAPLPTLTGSTTARLETVAHALGVAGWSTGSLPVLKGLTGRPEQLFTVALNTPEYLVH